MRSFMIVSVIAVMMLVSSAVVAMQHRPEDRGKVLFNDPKLSGGSAGRSCNTCHPDGKGLEGVGEKKNWKTPGGEFKTLEEAVNICITMALKGKALEIKSEQMKDIVSYLKTFKVKTGETPVKKPAMGC
jgi:cytochrome c peroxidase